MHDIGKEHVKCFLLNLKVLYSIGAKHVNYDPEYFTSFRPIWMVLL
jgi:hypothetical protein